MSQTNITAWPDTIPVPQVARTHRIDPRMAPTLMESGRMRNRRIYPEPIELIDVTWNFTSDEFEAFKDFFEAELENGSLHFTLAVPDFAPPLTDRTVTRELAFWEGNYAFARGDNLFSVKATLEIVNEFTVDVALPPPENSLPELELTYPTVCRSEFVLTFTPATTGRLYSIQTAYANTGPWGHHVIVPVLEGHNGTVSRTFNNDYNGIVWFRVVTGRFQVNGVTVVSKRVKPLASVIQAPRILVAHTRDVLQEFDKDTNFNYPRKFWAPSVPERANLPGNIDGHDTPTLVHPIPYALSYLENLYFSPTAIYHIPRYRVEWRLSNPGEQDVANDFDTRVSIEDEVDSITTWTRDGSEPTVDTVIQKLNGIENNAAVHREDFAYVIRARSFKGGCRSPLTTLIVDKRIPYKHNIIISLTGKSQAGYCDLTRGDGWESGYSCIVNFGSACGFARTMAGEVGESHAFAGLSHDILSIATGSISRHLDYMGWTNFAVDATSYSISSVDINRGINSGHNWDQYNVNAHTFLIAENTKETDIGSECQGFSLQQGWRKTQALIGPSKCFPDYGGAGSVEPNGPGPIVWLGPGRDNGSMNTMASIGLRDTRFGLAHNAPIEEILDGAPDIVDQFGNINYTMFPPALNLFPYGHGFAFGGHLSLLDILLTVHDDTKFFGEKLNYWFTDPDFGNINFTTLGISPLFRTAFYRPDCIYDENCVTDYYSNLVDPDSGINLGLKELAAWGPLWDGFPAPPAPPVGGYPPPVIDNTIANYAGDNFEAYALESPLVTTLSEGNHFSGSWVIVALISYSGGDNFEAYSLGTLDGTESLDNGEGFGSPWTIKTGSSITGETFETYPIGIISRTDVFEDGTGFGGGWVIKNCAFGSDDFESYAVGPIGVMEGGTGWTSEGWVIV